MNKERLDQLIMEGKLKMRSVDVPKINSLITAAKVGIIAVQKVPLIPETSTLVFREYYECIRQLGDARWLSLGYEPKASHEVSMEILMGLKIENSIKLQNLDRFRKIRNNANYRGYIVSVEEATEIEDFWSALGENIIKEVEKGVDG